MMDLDLVGTDGDYIRLLCGPLSPEVERVLRLRPQRLAGMAGLKGFDRTSALRDAAKLMAQVMVAPVRRDGVRADSLFFERSRAVVPARSAFLSRFLSRAVVGIAMDSRLVGHASWFGSLKLTFEVVRLLLDPRAEESVLASGYVGILRTCLIVESNAAAMNAEDAYLFRVYRPETPFLAARLMNAGIRVHQVASTGPLLPNTPAVVASTVVLCNPFQLDEIAWMRDRGLAWPDAVLWGPEDVVDLETASACGVSEAHPEVLGLYTQGFRARVRRGTEPESTGARSAEHEERLRRLLIHYIDDHPDVELVVYPHPLERRIFREEGVHDLRDLEGHERVRIDWSSTSSLSCFSEVGLGVTTFSTVGFDRLHLGYPTIFFVTDEVSDEIPSPFQRLFIRDDAALTAALGCFRMMTPETFTHEVLGGSRTCGAKVN